jgi:hypothetical protein
MKKTILLTIVVLLSTTGLTAGVTRLVPAEYATIQDAIDACVDGDLVVVAPGTYTGDGNRDINFGGRAITVRSVDPNDPTTVAATIIDCQASFSDQHRGFYFYGSSVRTDSVIDGLTITNGFRHSGGGICCDGYSSPKIVRCRIVKNSGRRGGGIYVDDGAPIIDRCVIMNNSVGPGFYTGEGGGMYSHSSTGLTISNCIIAGNSAIGASIDDRGGGIFLVVKATLKNCTIISNTAQESGGIFCNKYANIKIENCIVCDNTAADLPQIGGNPTVSYSNIQGGFTGIGTIDTNPLFVNTGAGDFHLSSLSPCIDAGDPYFLPIPSERDIDNEPRVMGIRADMGVDEFTATPTPVIGISPTSFTFQADQGGSNPEEQVLSVHSAGYSNLIWNISHDCSWLNVDPTQGESTGEIDPVSLSADTQELGLGEYTCELSITAVGASNSPLKVPVTLYIRPVDGILDVPSEYETIQSAINAAQNGDTVIAAPMTYNGKGNHDIDFCGKAITVRSVDPNEPNTVAATVIDCEALGRGFNFHSGEDLNSVLAGLTVTNGSADDGCGIYINSSSPLITRCVIIGNSSDEREVDGGGICIRNGNPIISHCTVSENSIGNYSTYGGGICCYGSNPVIKHCTITNNYVRDRGGGIHCQSSSPLISHCIIQGNTASFRRGGGICSWSASPIITNCLITGNTCGYDGGGISLVLSNTVISRCSIIGNEVGVFFERGITVITNSVIWNNGVAGRNWCGGIPMSTDGMISSPESDDFSSLSISYSDIENGKQGIFINNPSWCTFVFDWGEGNIDADPCFVEPGYWDKSGTWIDADYHLLPDSPCINAGDPNLTYNSNEKDLDGKPRVMGGRIDMGAYEFTFIQAEVRITPRTINLASKSKWLTCYIWLPDDYSVADIDSNAIFLFGKIQAESVQVSEKQQVAIAEFSREEVQTILNIGEVELSIIGWLIDGTIFEGKDVIKVTNKSSGKHDKYVQASVPNPPDGATSVSVYTDLSWTASPYATSHDVYFGTSSPPPFVCNQIDTAFDPGMMDSGRTYYWCINEVNKWGKAIGQLWSFTTIEGTPPPPPPPPVPPPPP